MKLFSLFPKFMELSSLDRTKFIQSYRESRAIALEENIKSKKGPALTETEKQLMKALGISAKQLNQLKNSL
ncbi:MAG: hypothetical protein EHM49_05085 [Deltaproteobacteria bacterium]|nr:MAG: hypothetical protein EHM49_05085 [Deltaproteobacteria bacterium]